MSDYLWPHRLYSPWNSPGQNTGVGSLSPLQGIFPTQGLNPGLPSCRQILYQLSHQGSPRILEWVASPFSSGSSQSRNQTGVSCIAGSFFTNPAMREALTRVKTSLKALSQNSHVRGLGLQHMNCGGCNSAHEGALTFAYWRTSEVYISLGIEEGFPYAVDKIMDTEKSKPCFGNGM